MAEIPTVDGPEEQEAWETTKEYVELLELKTGPYKGEIREEVISAPEEEIDVRQLMIKLCKDRKKKAQENMKKKRGGPTKKRRRPEAEPSASELKLYALLNSDMLRSMESTVEKMRRLQERANVAAELEGLLDWMHRDLSDDTRTAAIDQLKSDYRAHLELESEMPKAALKQRQHERHYELVDKKKAMRKADEKEEKMQRKERQLKAMAEGRRKRKAERDAEKARREEEEKRSSPSGARAEAERTESSEESPEMKSEEAEEIEVSLKHEEAEVIVKEEETEDAKIKEEEAKERRESPSERMQTMTLNELHIESVPSPDSAVYSNDSGDDMDMDDERTANDEVEEAEEEKDEKDERAEEEIKEEEMDEAVVENIDQEKVERAEDDEKKTEGGLDGTDDEIEKTEEEEEEEEDEWSEGEQDETDEEEAAVERANDGEGQEKTEEPEEVEKTEEEREEMDETVEYAEEEERDRIEDEEDAGTEEETDETGEVEEEEKDEEKTEEAEDSAHDDELADLRLDIDEKEAEDLHHIEEITLDNFEEHLIIDPKTDKDKLKNLRFLARYGIIYSTHECEDCKEVIVSLTRDASIDGYGWRCGNCWDTRNHEYRASVRTACFFEGIDAPISKIIHAALIFIDQLRQDRPTLTLDQMAQRSGVDVQTFGQWRNYFLDIIQEVVCKSAVQDKIGGAAFAVEVHVAYRYKNKYGLGTSRPVSYALVFKETVRELYCVVDVTSLNAVTLANAVNMALEAGTEVWVAQPELFGGSVDNIEAVYDKRYPKEKMVFFPLNESPSRTIENMRTLESGDSARAQLALLHILKERIAKPFNAFLAGWVYYDYSNDSLIIS